MNNIFELIFYKSYDSIMVCDKDGKIIMVNPSTEKIYHMKTSEMIGHTPDELLNSPALNPHPDHVVISNAKKVLATKQMQHSIIEHPNHLAFVTSVPVFDEQGEIEHIITNARSDVVINEFYKYQAALKEKNDIYKEILSHLSYGQNNQLIAQSPQMLHVIEQCRIIANSDCNILITGESGVGKEVIAQYLHMLNQSQEAPFVPVNCSAIPSELFESEFFGYLSGAFTGANRGGKVGLLQMAHNGTLFLDEIGELPLSMQAKLLRFIETGEFYPVGSSVPKKVTVRIIAATNRNLSQMIKENKFRSDLHYRLNVFPISIAPLRERPEDVEAMAVSFLTQFNRKYQKDLSFSNFDLRLLLSYSWPGNVRELRNLIERTVLIASSETLTQTLQSNLFTSNEPSVDLFQQSQRKEHQYLSIDLNLPYKEAMAELEREYLLASIKKHNGNIEKTAAALGIHRATLYRKIKERP